MEDNVKSKKKLEFSKLWLLSCVIISFIFTATSYILSMFDKQTLESLSSTIIETLWGTSGISFVGYALQNSVRAYTASKFGLPENRRGGEQNALEMGTNNCSNSSPIDGVFSHSNE